MRSALATASLIVVSSLLAVLGIVLVSCALTEALAPFLDGPRARRRMEARGVEAGNIAALAQRWSRTPAVLGGPVLADEGFGAVTFDTLGLHRDAHHARVRHTDIGTYRLLAVAPCETLSGCAALAATEAPAGGGLLVVGTCDQPDEAVAILVLGPLVQIPLPAVPWGWVRRLTTPVADPLMPRASTPSETPAVVTEAPRKKVRASEVPQRARRVPKWRGPMPRTRRRDRELA